MKKVSIIVPIYNIEKYIGRCVSSLLHQSLVDIEIILVDDESLDNCPSLCDEFARQDSRIRVVHKKNAGLGFARNSGLDVATGEYVAFVDGDDFVDLNMYETLYNDAQKEHADLVYCNMQREQPDGTWQSWKEMKKRSVFVGNEVPHLLLDIVASAPFDKTERKYQMSVWHAIYRRSIIEDNHIRFMSEREIVSEDIPFDVDYLSKCQKVVYRSECFYYYCLNGASLTSQYLPDKFYRYKQLYYYLKNALSVYGDDGIYRSNRFFVGMVRTQILHLAMIPFPNKLSILRDMSDDNVWDDVLSTFRYDSIPKTASLLLWLLLKKHHFLLLQYARFYNFMRSYRH